LHRGDILSDRKVKKVVRRSASDLGVDVNELYYIKVKNIYGQIINYATIGQANLDLSVEQHKEVAMIKVATRKMVEIIRDVANVSRNVQKFNQTDNLHLRKEYDRLRKRIAKVLRVIYQYRTVPEGKEATYQKLLRLKEAAGIRSNETSESIDQLIRNDLISIDMASSLVNDYDEVNDAIEKLITVAEILYAEKDSILQNGIE
jgi:phosphate:Na+ symporter